MRSHPGRSFAFVSRLFVLSGAAFGFGCTTSGPTSGPPATGPISIINGKECAVPDIRLGDASTVRRIIDEGKNRNEVMSHLKHLTEEIGPRLTGSSRAEAANNWCRERYASWGLSNARLEAWGDVAVRFDRGPSSGALYVKSAAGGDSPKVRDFELAALSWSPGTNGPVRGPVVREPGTEEAFNAVQSRLAGAWVLMPPGGPNGEGMRGIRRGMGDAYQMRREALAKVASGTPAASLPLPQRLSAVGVAGFISTTRDERVWTGAIPGWRELDLSKPAPPPHVTVRGSDYDAINSRLADGEPVEVEINLEHRLTPGPFAVYNTIAEIPGTTWPDEVVIVSAHLDSWDGPGSQGCTDNGTGSAVTLEAARILTAVKARPKRTIRFINWTGEEQGLLGSAAYVKAHADELPKISAVFVDDGGTNYEGGLGAAECMVPMLAAATAPLNNVFYSETDAKYLNVNVRSTGPVIESHGGSDHASFNAVGVPGFYWDEVGRADYGHGWHTQFDRYDLAIPEYLVQSSTCVAVTAYNLADAPELVPRPRAEDKKPE